MKRDVTPLLRPRQVAIVGASATRKTQGNGVIENLRTRGYGGEIIPVHPQAETIDGLAAARSIETLPVDTDLAVVAIPAPGVTDTLRQLDEAGVRAAMVFSNGFTPGDEAAFRRFAATSRLTIHGPNCMGAINLADKVVLYPSTITDKVTRGKVALIAQSGSAAISLMNSSAAGFSTVVTMGSEFQVTAPDYMRWFAADDATQVIAIVLESIKDPASFAEAVGHVRAAGKALVVLKVGRSDFGAKAVQAHTGALISPQDAYDCFFESCGVPTVQDYDQLIASLECFATCKGKATGFRIGIVGISGGETALACDVAAELGVPLAVFGETTRKRVKTALQGATGANPLDLGATVHHTVEQDKEALDAILDDPDVDALLVVQDVQATLTPTMRGNYTPRIRAYGQHGAGSVKPVVLVSPSSENTHPDIMAEMAQCGVPVLRGLRGGIAAIRSLGIHGHSLARRGESAGDVAISPSNTKRAAMFRQELGGLSGPVGAALTAKILAAYNIPMVRSAFAATVEEALARADAVGYPLVLKISSADIPHRSDVGGVELDIRDRASLREAIERMVARVKTARPHARIDGFELQEQLTGWTEAMAGFMAADPFGALTIVGTGGTMVELHADRVVGLSPLSLAQARDMISRTRLGTLLSGYRNLMPVTALDGLAGLVANLSRLAADLSGCLSECDVNPVLVKPGSGEVRVVDALLVAGRRNPS